MTVLKTKKQKTQKVCHKKMYYKHSLEATQLENKTSYLEKNKIDIDSIKEFIKNNKLILKMQQMFKSERHNVFAEETKKIAPSSNDYES